MAKHPLKPQPATPKRNRRPLYDISATTIPPLPTGTKFANPRSSAYMSNVTLSGDSQQRKGTG
jgi:hypothetical protein